MLRLECRSYRYPGTRSAALRDLVVEVSHGEVVGVVGPNDAGKSTLCLLASGLAPTVVGGSFDGMLDIDGRSARGRPAHELVGSVGYAFQNPRTQISGMAKTVLEEVGLPELNLGRAGGEIARDSQTALERLGIADLALRDPSRLSGGETQLVAIASLVALRPDHLVLDEPTSQLDPAGTRLVAAALRRLAADGMALLVAEHRADLLDGLCDRLVVLDGGTIVRSGPTGAVYDDPSIAELGVSIPSRVRLTRAALAAGASLDAAALAAVLAGVDGR